MIEDPKFPQWDGTARYYDDPNIDKNPDFWMWAQMSAEIQATEGWILERNEVWEKLYPCGDPQSILTVSESGNLLAWRSLVAGTGIEITANSASLVIAATGADKFLPYINLQGTVFHVALNGSDSNSGSSKAEAFLTLQAAIDAAAEGDTVLVHPGVYEVAAEVTCNKGILIRALHGPLETTIKPTTGSQIRCMYVYATKYCVVDGFTFRDGNTTLVGAGINPGNGGGLCIWQNTGVSPAVLGSYAINCRFVNCYAQQYGGGAYLMDHKSAVINCVFDTCSTTLSGFAGGGGIGLRWEGYARNCVVYNCSAAYGAVMMYAGECKVENCTIVNNIASGIVAHQGTQHIYNSIIFNNAAGNITRISSTLDVKHTSSSPLPSGTNNLSIAPVFDNTDDYRLVDSSELIGMGMPLSWHSQFTDIMGSQRVVGCVDLGASQTMSFGLSLENINRYSNSLVTQRVLNMHTPAAPSSDGNYVLNVNGSTLTWVSV